MMEYKLFQPKKYTEPADWKQDLASHVAAVDALLKEGAEKADDLQLFLSEIVWAVVRSELTVAHAVELLAKTPVATKDPLQRLFADVLWMVGFAATEGGPRESKDEFHSLCEQLEKEGVLPRKLLALALESESVPAAVCQVAQLKKKNNQAKTKARYTITRYNLLRDNSEGFSKLLVLFDKLAGLDFEPAPTEEQLRSTEETLADDVVRLAGFDHLCPNRMLSIALEVYELRLMEEKTCALAKPVLGLLKRFPPNRITEVVTFQLLAHSPPPSSREGSLKNSQPQPPLTPPSRASQFLAVATLVQKGLVDLDTLWNYLDPADAALKQLGDDLVKKHEEEVASVTKIDLGSSSSAKEVDTFNDAFQEFNRAGCQKVRLAAALVSVNDWRSAHRVLKHLSKSCQPCLNHYIRSALCDLLKWVIAPLISSVVPICGGRKPDGSGAPGMESTFGCMRRFAFGIEIADASKGAAKENGTNGDKATNGNGASGAPEVPAALRPTADLEAGLAQIKLVLEHLDYFLHTDVILLTSLWRVVLVFLQQKKKEQGDGAQVSLDDRLVALVYRHLLPAASLVPNNPHLGDVMWSVMSQLSIFQRFMIYSCWETMYDNFLLKLAYERTKSATKQVLKRVVANAEKKDLIAHQSNFHICKLCHSNPMPVIETMLKDIEIGFNVNMIQPYVECTSKCSDMTADIMAYMLARSCAKPCTPQRQFLNQKTATLSPWLVGLGEFIGRFYKKHPQTELVGLLTIITKRISSEAPEVGEKKEPVLPAAEYRGESLIRVIFESLIEHVGGLTTVADMNEEQLMCLAGGPRLKSESVSVGKRDNDKARQDRSRQALVKALVDLKLIPILWNSLSQQRHHFLSEDFCERHGSAGGLKLIGLLFDGSHECFLKLTEFLCQACTRDKYWSLLPPLQQVFAMWEPACAFSAIRHGLPPFGRPLMSSDESASEPAAMVELERVSRLALPKGFEQTGLTLFFYTTFWRLQLHDIFVPNEGYERAAAGLQASMQELDKKIRDSERRNREFAHSREGKALYKEKAKLQDTQAKLKEEHLAQKLNHEQVMTRLNTDKLKFYSNPSPQATASFVSEMIAPRVFHSHADALFCCHFIRMLIRMKINGFQLLDFYNTWTIMLTQCVRSCSEREAQIFGVFLKEMMSYVIHLRSQEAKWPEIVKENPAFFRNYYQDFTQAQVTEFSDICKGHCKWEGRIFKVVAAGLQSDEWMERRNTLLLLSQCYEAFPLCEKYGLACLQHVQRLAAKETFTDLKTLAESLCVRLKSQRPKWVERRSRPEPPATAEAKDGGKSAGPKSGLPSGKDDGDGKDRKRDRDHAAGEKDGEPPEKRSRSRRVSDDGHKEAKDSKEGRDHKKDVKDASRDGKATVIIKDSKEAKESSRDHKDAADRKRGSGESRHEDRSDNKRRRSERDEVHSSRGGGSRNALTATEVSLRDHRGSDYPRGGRSSGGYTDRPRHGDAYAPSRSRR